MAEQTKNRPRGGHAPGQGAPVEKAKDFKGTLKKLISYIGAYKIPVFFVMIFAIASTVFNICIPKFYHRRSQNYSTA